MAKPLERVTDAHIHLSGRKDDALLPYARRNGLGYTLTELLGEMGKNGITQGLLLSPPMKEGRPLPNEDVLGFCKMSGGALSPVLTAEPTKKDVAAAINMAEENRGSVKAFKVRLGYVKATAADSVFDDLYDFAQAKELPVLFHTGDTATSDGDLARSHPLALDALANEREELTIVACHFGNPWIEDVAELIYKHPKVYADTSGLSAGEGGYSQKYSEWLARKVSEAIYYAGGAEKVIFGTDYPVTTHANALALVQKLDVTKSDRERILWRNAREVFGV